MTHPSMLRFAVAHALLEHPRLCLHSVAPPDVQRSLQKASKISPMVQNLLRASAGPSDEVACVSELLKRIQGNHLHPAEQAWLAAHRAGLEGILDCFGNEEEEIPAQVAHALLESPAVEKKDRTYITRFIERAAREKVGLPLDRIREDDAWLQFIGDALAGARGKENAKTLLKSLMPQYEESEREMQYLRKNPTVRQRLFEIYSNALLLDPSVTKTSSYGSDWSTVVRHSIPFYTHAGDRVNLDHVWDLLHYAAHYGHGLAEIILNYPQLRSVEPAAAKTALTDSLTNLRTALARHGKRYLSEGLLEKIDAMTHLETALNRFILRLR